MTDEQFQKLMDRWDVLVADELDARGPADEDQAIERVEALLVIACQELGIDRDDLKQLDSEMIGSGVAPEMSSRAAVSRARRELVLMGKVVSAGIDPETGMTMWCLKAD
jgi:hypothetical protein